MEFLVGILFYQHSEYIILLLSHMVSDEKSVIILIEDPLYVMTCFFLAASRFSTVSDFKQSEHDVSRCGGL